MGSQTTKGRTVESFQYWSRNLHEAALTSASVRILLSHRTHYSHPKPHEVRLIANFAVSKVVKWAGNKIAPSLSLPRAAPPSSVSSVHPSLSVWLSVHSNFRKWAPNDDKMADGRRARAVRCSDNSIANCYKARILQEFSHFTTEASTCLVYSIPTFYVRHISEHNATKSPPPPRSNL